MNQKYIIIFLLISIIITISCKCNKLNINEHFNEEVAGTNSIDNSDKNSIDIVSLDYNNIKFTDCLNEGENELNEQINLNIEGIYNTFDNIIDNSQKEINDFNKKYNDEMDNLQQLWHDIKELQNTEYLEENLEDDLSYTINDLKDGNIFDNPDDNGSNDCEKYVKPYKKNQIINENIENLLNNNKIWKTDDDSDNTFEKKVNDNFDNYKNAASGLKEQLKEINNKFLEINKTLTGSPSIFGSLESNITTNKNKLYNSLQENSGLIQHHIENLEQLVIEYLQKKKEDNELKIDKINNIFTITNNFIKSPTSPDFNGINSDDDSIKKHCNIGGLMNGSGICYTERDYQGCFIECKTRKVNGDCAIESELGQPNPSNYTNVFGSTISVHKHAHKHPGPHPHK